ncbi:hypothetical protein DC60_06915 [Streptomyces wadayamensis]|uniref:Uncharacterized protein n=1 Tax=Streptomyces wadayamensis TaxID=141454 RepID=A0ABR4S8P0_9ACTN|nr:hypothetical protein DC60_06915 [Streptomyces wadayamensis]
MPVSGRSVVLQSLTRTVAGAPPGLRGTPSSGWSWARVMRLPFSFSLAVSSGHSSARKASRPGWGAGPPVSAAPQPVASRAAAIRAAGAAPRLLFCLFCLLTGCLSLA